DLSWSAVPGAEGYLLFRNGLESLIPLAVLEGEQRTNYTDMGLDINSEYTYHVVPFSFAEGNVFVGGSVSATGYTTPFGFSVVASSEADVTFAYEFDNHLLLNLVQQAAYVEIYDYDNGTLMYGDELTLTDIAEEALLFDNSLQFSGSSANDINTGVYATPNLGTLDQWTTEMWVNTSLSSGYPYLFDDGNIHAFVDLSSRLVIKVGNQGYWSDYNKVPYDTWNHIALSYDGSLTVYVDGELVPMAPGTSSTAFSDAQVVSGVSLTDALQFGEPFDKAGLGRNWNGQMGMIRVWDRARTADQIAVDYQDIYTLPATGLLGQWTFDNETVNLTSDVSAAVLSILTDNVASHPISWTPSYAFVEAEVQKEVTTWLQEPVADGTPRTYEISIYETGTGRLLTQSKDDHTFSHPGTPVVTATASKENPYQIGVSVFPYSQRADEYAITRADGKGNLTNLGTVGYTTQNTVGEFDNTDYIKFENTRLVPSTGWYLHVPFKHYESTSPQGIVVGDNINYEFRAYVDANNQLELSYHRAVDANAYTWVNTQAEVTPNEWHDLIVVQNASSGALDVYLDQALVTSFEASSTWLDLRYIGSGGYGANHAAYNSANFHGQIAYVNYHATPLTEDQVLNMTREYPQGNLLYWTAEGMQWVLNGIAQTPTLTLESDIDVVEGIDFGVPFLGLEDAYAYGDATSILGDDNYTYTATPVYNQLDRSYADDAHAGISNTVYTMDYGVSATALNDETGITVDWNVSSLTGAGYDTVRIERNGDVLALTPTTNSSWTDTLMLYGIDYTYSVIAMGNGQPALAQSATTRLSANGSVTATLISQNGDYVLPNKTAYLTTEGATVATVAADTYGAVDATGIFYDQSMDFSWA
ncbi:MAG TPA: hypothetical protein DCE41_23580, partial [Cytophagales bacterium]|nr:hypothetical protein [Cytophagales bacterium]